MDTEIPDLFHKVLYVIGEGRNERKKKIPCFSLASREFPPPLNRTHTHPSPNQSSVAVRDIEEMLDWVESKHAHERRRPKVFGIGHSLGASAIVLEELLLREKEASAVGRRRFMGGLALIEPILMPMDRHPNASHPLADRALKRKAKWYVCRDHLGSSSYVYMYMYPSHIASPHTGHLDKTHMITLHQGPCLSAGIRKLWMHT